MASSASVGFRGREGMRWIIYEAFRRCQYECFRSSIELDRAWPYTAAAARLFFIEVGRVTGQVVIRRAVKRTILLTFAVAMFASPESWPRHPSGDDPIRVVLPPGVEIRSCKLEYFLVGVFGDGAREPRGGEIEGHSLLFGLSNRDDGPRLAA